MISLNGDINTGILIRTAHLRDGVAKYSVGATLLYDSIPENEELETRMKATGFFAAIRAAQAPPPKQDSGGNCTANQAGKGIKLLLVDNEDCFIHTLANYARQTGSELVTYRAGIPSEMIREIKPDVILVSPGPGRPSDFGVPDLIRTAARLEIPVFGVCLGLQGMVEAFGGELGVLDYPMHGKPSTIISRGVGVFEGLPERFKIGRYHSLYALPEKAAGGVRSDCSIRRWNHHGNPSPDASDGSRSIPSRIDSHARRRSWPAPDREHDSHLRSCRA